MNPKNLNELGNANLKMNLNEFQTGMNEFRVNQISFYKCREAAELVITKSEGVLQNVNVC